MKFFHDAAAVLWRDWCVLKRRLPKFVLSRTVAPLLYLTAFGWGLGRSVNVAGGSYLDFIVPGILALNSMNVSFHGMTTLHAERVYHKSLEVYLTSPVNSAAFLTGKILSALVRAFVAAMLILILAYLFGATLKLSAALFAVVALNAVIFAEVGFIAAMYIDTYEEMAQVNTYILLPMSFLCGTFFSTSALPSAVRFVVELLPLTHAGILLRSIMSAAAIPAMSVLVLVSYAATGYWLSLRAFNNLRK